MSDFTPINPKPFLRDLIDKSILVTLKFNKTQYKGTLVSADNYFNLQLREAEEIVDNKSRGLIGEIFIRCNNVLWIGEDLKKTETTSEQALKSEKLETSEPSKTSETSNTAETDKASVSSNT
ncbi:hypothetical protein HG535_0C06180 [Zygotorulaspora mrakii]|uniref:Sm protein F n=1 Tax=Zygotorulaspora mrakii TaxID=42260 RepID=A0A7H9B162_ZYGMR|nr:uncharacterized protein HG535_0C06180 [Zygotorulaspora mrakii]QLG72263.1 hypothetical protein HG535_0C06180 [Zygotorulaspora mrakii]